MCKIVESRYVKVSMIVQIATCLRREASACWGAGNKQKWKRLIEICKVTEKGTFIVVV